MDHDRIAQLRLYYQRISTSTFQSAAEVVRWLTASQAQDYFGAKWALALRLPGTTDADWDRAFKEGAILRTHLLRPTWHFVTPEDIRWLLALTGPRVHAANAYMYRKLELDETVLRRSDSVIEKALRGGKQLTRDELRAVLEGGIPAAENMRTTYMVMHAELEGIICSGARRGNQFTYALLEERVPPARVLDREEALVELARRYFTSRGPSTLQDFVKWSGLTTADAKRGLQGVQELLRQETISGSTFWLPKEEPRLPENPSAAYLLSIYDEYISSYKDHSAVIEPEHGARLAAMGNALYYILVLDGRVVGTWKRTLQKEAVRIEISPFRRLTDEEIRAVSAGAQRYAAFLGLEPDLSFE